MPARVRREDGSAVVELALVLPILFLVLLAAVQVGLVARDQLLVVQASRAGAREATVTLEEGSIRAAALDAAPGLDPGRVEVAVARDGGQGQVVAVTVGYRVVVVGPLAGWLLPAEIRLESTAAMRQEVA